MAIARALIQQMPILMLDEGTSALDLQTAYDIERTLLGIGELTVITITHKLSEEILSQYDEIIVMDHGQIVEAGTFDELVQRQGAFYKLYTLKKEGMCNTFSRISKKPDVKSGFSYIKHYW